MTSSEMAAADDAYEVRALRPDELDAWFDHLEVRAPGSLPQAGPRVVLGRDLMQTER